MKLRSKLTAMLLIAGLVSAAMVGGTAYWLLMRDFSQSLMDEAFGNFQRDVTAYLYKYGTWSEGQRHESFHQFVHEHHLRTGPPRHQQLRDDISLPREGTPPFHFMLLTPDGRVVNAAANYTVGQLAPQSLLADARPISLNGKIAVMAVPLGSPILTPVDRSYLSAMRRALLSGFLAAAAVAILLGLLFGRRMSITLDELTTAIHSMRSNGELQQQVQVRTKDELGELAAAFNEMSTELAFAHNELRELSIRDPLTQLYNRRHFNEQAGQLFEQAKRFGHPLSVMIADLDHFKQINDNYSHAMGDEVLLRVGTLLRQNNRKSDILARHGGEEFVILFTETTLEQAISHCERLRQQIESQPWHKLDVDLRVTMSIGVSADLSLGSIEKMLHEADDRLYIAKHAGRNRVEPVV